MTTSEEIFQHAWRDNGLRETPGVRSTPRIAYAIRLSADWLNPDDTETPWCGCIRGVWGIETGTGVPKEHYRAKSWSTWGKKVVGEPEKGDTVVLKRSGGHHVGLFVKQTADEIWLFGGNQSNAVNISRFSRSHVVAIRR